MKRIVEDVSDEGLESFLGENVTLWCERYIYAGKLTGVNDTCVLLQDAHIVYQTGPLSEDGFEDTQKLPSDWYIQTCKIESFGRMA